jgi:hypothetical protein
MKVYVLEGHVSYEGFEIIGIFSSKEKAELVMSSVPMRTRTSRGFDDCDITEHEVQE